jgi:hypothetical protein
MQKYALGLSLLVLTVTSLVGCGESTPTLTQAPDAIRAVTDLPPNEPSIQPSIQPTPPEVAPAILSAFFSLDNALPQGSEPLCEGSDGLDGLSLVLSRRVNSESVTLDPSAFKVFSGTTEGVVKCATLAPAVEPGERRTILLIGEFGTAEAPPTQVEIVGDIPLRGDASAQGLVTTDIVPLEAGPSLVLAGRKISRSTPPTPSAEKDDRRGDHCPNRTAQVVKLTWNAGVSPTRDQLQRGIQVQLAGFPEPVSPVTLSDLRDGDNHTDLCLRQSAPAQKVVVAAGLFADPNGDLNERTIIEVYGQGDQKPVPAEQE